MTVPVESAAKELQKIQQLKDERYKGECVQLQNVDRLCKHFNM